VSLADKLINLDQTVASEILPRWAERVRRSIMKNFAQGGRPDKWKQSKRAAAGNGQTLKQSGRLHNSITYAITGRKVTWGTNKIYAAIHNFGGKIKPRVTPKMRKFFWAKYFETEDEKWKYLALTVKKRLTINIQKRQYMMIQQEDLNYLPKLINEVLNA
jgi:phage virion morphogenesis protein